MKLTPGKWVVLCARPLGNGRNCDGDLVLTLRHDWTHADPETYGHDPLPVAISCDVAFARLGINLAPPPDPEEVPS